MGKTRFVLNVGHTYTGLEADSVSYIGRMVEELLWILKPFHDLAARLVGERFVN